MFPRQHFALIDTDCVPVTLFEVQDLVELAHRQLQWAELVGHARTASGPSNGTGALLFTEAHLELSAGLVISTGSDIRPSPVRMGSTSAILARELHEYRQRDTALAREEQKTTLSWWQVPAGKR